MVYYSVLGVFYLFNLLVFNVVFNTPPALIVIFCRVVYVFPFVRATTSDKHKFGKYFSCAIFIYSSKISPFEPPKAIL